MGIARLATITGASRIAAVPLLNPEIGIQMFRGLAACDEATEHLDADFRIQVWRPNSGEIDKICFRLRFRESSLVRDAITSSTERFDLLEDFVDPTNIVENVEPRPPTNFVEASAELHARLARNRSRPGEPVATDIAFQRYESLVRGNLITPLQHWALAHDDPVVRSTVVVLAEVGAQLQLLSPRLYDLKAQELSGSGAPRNPEEFATLAEQFVKMCGQFGSLCNTISRRKDKK